MIDVIMTVQNGNKLARVIEDSPALLGWETSNKDPGTEYNVEFCDWPFTADNPDPEEHIEATARHNPKYAVAPDIEKEWSLDDVVAIGDELADYAENVIVVPKSVEPDYVPERFVIGYPNQPNWGTNGAWWRAEYHRDVHVLGGSPDSQLDVAGYMPVKSVDGANIAAYAKYGRVWTPGGQLERPDIDYYERIRESLGNYYAVLNGKRGETDA